ncbi:hypothetical protein [Paenibacillus dendrobii]|uniref:hypothetical protein n=1 Tax=Paenibacillus dendrobii TaxID=2691084 RepID=UPI00136CD099|nr:hypothetical protein [Paenibacillus dendrobii]
MIRWFICIFEIDLTKDGLNPQVQSIQHMNKLYASKLEGQAGYDLFQTIEKEMAEGRSRPAKKYMSESKELNQEDDQDDRSNSNKQINCIPE